LLPQVHGLRFAYPVVNIEPLIDLHTKRLNEDVEFKEAFKSYSEFETLFTLTQTSRRPYFATGTATEFS